MIRKITLKNFMSHRHTVIDLADGLTVLTGENNSGKSAVVEALHILCYNAKGNYMVRHGTRECSIVVETAEGHTIEWKRKGAVVSYTINGEQFHRLGSKVPEKLHQLLRVPKAFSRDNSESFDIHFGNQKKPIFLLDEPGSQAAKFFASYSDAEVLIQMQHLHKKKVNDEEKRRKQLEREYDEGNLRLQPLQTIENVQKEVHKLEQKYDSIVKNANVIDSLSQTIIRLQKMMADFHWYKHKKDILEMLTSPPRLLNTDAGKNLILMLRNLYHKIAGFERRQQILATLLKPPSLLKTEALEEQITEIKIISRNLQDNTNISEVLSCIPPNDLFHSSTEIKRHYELLEVLLKKINSWENNVVKQKQASLRAAEAVKNIENKLRDWIQENPTCPVCGGTWDIARLMATTTSRSEIPS